MTQLRKATRQKAKMRLGISGPSGSGKTYSALLIASGITSWDKIAVIDTENGSADLYESLGDYNVIPINAPYKPQKYIDAIDVCVKEGMEVIIIDSITHEWSGKGGCLEMHDDVVKGMKVGNSFTAWAKITPIHQAFIDKILQCPLHIITTVRSKTDYVLTEKNGKQVPTKVGMAPITREGFEYELTISLEIDHDHKAFVSKDRTGLFTNSEPFIPNKETGATILNWCNSGADKIVEVVTPKAANGQDLSELPADIAPYYQRTNDAELAWKLIEDATDRGALNTFININMALFTSNEELKDKARAKYSQLPKVHQ